MLAVPDAPLVNHDYVGAPHSATIDAEFTAVVDLHLVHLMAWHDNEMGYATRLAELIGLVGERL